MIQNVVALTGNDELPAFADRYRPANGEIDLAEVETSERVASEISLLITTWYEEGGGIEPHPARSVGIVNPNRFSVPVGAYLREEADVIAAARTGARTAAAGVSAHTLQIERKARAGRR